jgi:integrase
MVGKLKERDVLILGDGTHDDGNCLFLRVRGSHRSWIVRGRINGERKDRGLGSARTTSLASARKARDKLIEQLRNGKDPVAEKRATKEAAARRITFGQAAQAVIDNDSASWRTSFDGRKKTLDDWMRSVRRDCKSLALKGVEEITVEDIEDVLRPYWDRGCLKAAHDFRMRLERVFGFAAAKRWRKQGTNPASWEIFEHLWPKTKKTKHPHAALPWRDAPNFLSRLRASPSMGARIVEFAMLTCARSGEVRGAKWSEVDFEARIWTIPASRMKANHEHVVPLSSAALALLERVMAGRCGEYIFPGIRLIPTAGRTKLREQPVDAPIGNNVPWGVVKRLAPRATLHGFRSCFRDWCGDHGIDRELAEHSLAHKFGSAVENAYARSKLLERRRPVMQAWADFLNGRESKVVPFRPAA